MITALSVDLRIRPKLTLHWSEQSVCALCGSMRRAEAQRRGLKRMYSDKKDHPLANDIDAVGAELAVAKHTGRYWPAHIYRFVEPDIPPDIEVRHGTRPDSHLIVRANDYDDRRFVLVTGTMPDFELVGWMGGSDAKRPEWRKDPNGDGKPCYMVPQSSLNNVSLLVCRCDDDVPF